MSAVGSDQVCLILGDNIFYGSGFGQELRAACADLNGALLFGYRVDDPERYGVAELGPGGQLYMRKALEETNPPE